MTSAAWGEVWASRTVNAACLLIAGLGGAAAAGLASSFQAHKHAQPRDDLDWRTNPSTAPEQDHVECPTTPVKSMCAQSPVKALFTPTKLFAPQEECSEVALVDTQLHMLIKEGAFEFPSKVDLSQYVQPASIDVPVVGKAYLVKEKVLPFQKKVRELIQDLTLECKDLSGEGAVLLKGQTYLVYCGVLHLPPFARGCLSPKSSIGRVDMMVRGVMDGCGLYDIVQGGEARELWLEISPRSFNVRIRDGLALTQLMVFMPWDRALSHFPPAPRDSAEAASPLHKIGADAVSADIHNDRLCFDEIGNSVPLKLHKGAVVLSVCVPKSTEGGNLAGYEALPTEDVIDLYQIGTAIPERFFRPISTSDTGRLTLEKDKFYILATKERVSVPVHLSAEMVPFSHHVGELRAHYAGFFDPGFGYGERGEIKGTVGVLEVRPHETINIYDGQPICLMEFFRNSHPPAQPYGFVGSSYARQEGPKLAKYFAPPKVRKGLS